MIGKYRGIFFLILITKILFSQNNTFSPYSRYGLGEINPSTFAHNAGMGGAHIALKPDSVIPLFINAGNPAAYSLVRLTTLEVGGTFFYSDFSSQSSSLKKWSTNFSYASLAFPVGNKGGSCLGIAPYSNLGYDLESKTEISGIGDVKYLYQGNGGLNKAYLGYGVMPFSERLIKFRTKNLYIADSMKKLSHGAYRFRQGINKLLSDLSFGVNVNYLFGSLQQTSRVVFPNTLLYNNTYYDQTVNMGDFTGNAGMQMAFTIDSAGKKVNRRALKEKVKITAGAFYALNNTINASYNSAGFNYILNGFGDEIFRDTILYQVNQSGKITLPAEIGVGLGFKKGERINIVADAAITQWSAFKYLNSTDTYKDNLRAAVGLNYVPEKYAAGNGAFWKRINYRFGLNYQSGFIQLANGGLINSYAINAGVGLPVGIGRLNSMVNISGSYGQTGPSSGSGTKENFWRVTFGFNFSDRWFQKFRYD
ncbi:MAG: hypothetical protein IPM51_09510 [Sphingobacteriaceae bacterium]|nr:hypothetical protein [Sphingobacteriaceae bacterium]